MLLQKQGLECSSGEELKRLREGLQVRTLTVHQEGRQECAPSL